MGSEHHFVPQFYLRNFSLDGRCINRLGPDDHKHILKASIKNQCSKRGFYDFHPKAEETLSLVEGRAASIIRELLGSESTNSLSSSDFSELMVFIVLQQCRTAAMADENNEVTDWIAKMWVGPKAAERGIDLNTVSIHDKYPTAIPLSAAVQLVPSTLDLQKQLLINSTGEPFITSDNPVVLHNHFAEESIGSGAGGWECRGIQVFFPLSPNATLMLYDGDVYHVQNAKIGRINVSRGDAISLNRLQILNSMNSVYFSDSAMAASLLERSKKLGNLRKRPRVRFVRTQPVKVSENRYSELVAHYRLLLPASASLQISKIRKEWQRVPVAKRTPLWRHYPYAPYEPVVGDVTRSYEVRSDGPKDFSVPELPE